LKLTNASAVEGGLPENFCEVLDGGDSPLPVSSSAGED
jgi:hypothetical protein